MTRAELIHKLRSEVRDVSAVLGWIDAHVTAELQEAWAARINAEVARRLVERGLPPDAARVVIVPDEPEARRRDQIIEDSCRRGMNEPAPKLPAFASEGAAGALNT